MKANTTSSPNDASASQQIDVIINQTADWRGKKLAQLRAIIRTVDSAVVEEVKWKMPSKPMGVAVWCHDGMICHADVLKKSVRLTFHKGSLMEDADELFNARLESSSVRAIDFHEDDIINEAALKALILEAVRVNMFNKGKTIPA
ncbi:MAG: DUF1801 domain-containing protein [Chloroflexota bacterium]